jgi:large repetitive protein
MSDQIKAIKKYATLFSVLGIGFFILIARPVIRTAEANSLLEGPVGPDDFRISEVGPDGFKQYGARQPAVAYNPAANEFLVVWEGHEAGDHFEIYGQRIDATTGEEVGLNDFMVSGVGPLPYVARRPDVAYNSFNNEYLVVWYGDTAATGDDVFEVFGRRLDGSTGEAIGDILSISEVDAYVALTTKVTYNPDDNEYLVAWIGTGPEDSAYEVYGRRLDADTGQKLGPAEFRASETGPDNNSNYLTLGLDLAYNTTDKDYMVVWSGVDNAHPQMAPGEIEVYGQRLTAAGERFGPFDFRLSYMGETGDAAYSAGHPSIAYNSVGNEFLVVFSGEDDSGALVEGEFEIWGARIRPGSNFVNIFPRRLSQTGGQGKPEWAAFEPAVSYDPDNNEYFIVWSADAPNPIPAVADDFEIYAARMPSTQNTIPQAFRLSDMGNGNPDARAAQPAVAFNTTNNHFLTVWRGDPGTSPLVDDEFEIFGQLYAMPQTQQPPTPTPPPGQTPSPSPTPPGTLNYRLMLPVVLGE